MHGPGTATGKARRRADSQLRPLPAGFFVPQNDIAGRLCCLARVRPRPAAGRSTEAAFRGERKGRMPGGGIERGAVPGATPLRGWAGAAVSFGGAQAAVGELGEDAAETDED